MKVISGSDILALGESMEKLRRLTEQFDDAIVEKMARLLCRLDAFRNIGTIASGAEMDHHVEHLWAAFKDDAQTVLRHR